MNEQNTWRALIKHWGVFNWDRKTLIIDSSMIYIFKEVFYLGWMRWNEVANYQPRKWESRYKNGSQTSKGRNRILQAWALNNEWELQFLGPRDWVKFKEWMIFALGHFRSKKSKLVSSSQTSRELNRIFHHVC